MKRPGEQRYELALDTLQTSLDDLTDAIELRVREEQQTNQLTKLPNLSALEEWLRTQAEGAHHCWVALVEVDNFKLINQQFGYNLADDLLVDIASVLQEQQTKLEIGARAYHAHGDEFYLAGSMPPAPSKELTPTNTKELIEGYLNQVREAISAKEKASSKGLMKCTVSVGWTTLEDAQTIDGGATDRSMMRIAEDANKAAKSDGKNRVRRWSPDIQLPRMVDPRVTCENRECGAVITVMVPAANWKQDSTTMNCPNCGVYIKRPFVERRLTDESATVERRNAQPPNPAPEVDALPGEPSNEPH